MPWLDLCSSVLPRKQTVPFITSRALRAECTRLVAVRRVGGVEYNTLCTRTEESSFIYGRVQRYHQRCKLCSENATFCSSCHSVSTQHTNTVGVRLVDGREHTQPDACVLQEHTHTSSRGWWRREQSTSCQGMVQQQARGVIRETQTCKTAFCLYRSLYTIET